MDGEKRKRLEQVIVNERRVIEADLSAGRFKEAVAGCSLLQDFQKIHDGLTSDKAAPGF